MGLIQTIAALKAAMDESATDQSDSAWQRAAAAAGLVPQGDTGGAGIDQDYVGAAGGLELRLKHTWRDTSKTFAPGPDRTRVRLEVRQGEAVLDSYTAGYEK